MVLKCHGRHPQLWLSIDDRDVTGLRELVSLIRGEGELTLLLPSQIPFSSHMKGTLPSVSGLKEERRGGATKSSPIARPSGRRHGRCWSSLRRSSTEVLLREDGGLEVEGGREPELSLVRRSLLSAEKSMLVIVVACLPTEEQRCLKTEQGTRGTTSSRRETRSREEQGYLAAVASARQHVELHASLQSCARHHLNHLSVSPSSRPCLPVGGLRISPAAKGSGFNLLPTNFTALCWRHQVADATRAREGRLGCRLVLVSLVSEHVHLR